ncbi:transporter (NhaC family) [Luteimonas cucumeris]|uniref:Transporter (NhaC family) n=1 Tax=Luteimonas cucumeris TaxID=985012 RepID=A0A562L0H1_9GAMM|nr:Na+/H+ antiporter NhaC [Luteimonas cucumeris]TWI01108.1 transporter (NhaC family) [Luteimonas cucumeris]
MTDPLKPVRTIRAPSYVDAFVPLLTLVVLIAGSLYLFGLDATKGPLQVALLLSSLVTAAIVLKNGHTWEAIAASAQRGVASVVSAIFILLAVGALIGTWNMSGTIPTMVYYGIKLMHPDWFYVAALVICSVVSLSIGSSWTTAGTIGVGLVGLSALVGVSPAITAGAVISGSYVGDKLSPLSETTILAAQLTGNDVYTHLRAQMWTSVPAFLIAALVFVAIGLGGAGVEPVDSAMMAAELEMLGTLFWITPLNLVPLLFLVVLSVRKTPASLAIAAAALLAGALAPFLQPEAVLRFVSSPELAAPAAHIKGIWLALANGYQANSGIPEMDALLSRGGMDSMLLTIWLIIGALAYGTLLDEFDLLSKLVTPLLLRAKSAGSLIATTAATAMGLNIIAGDQYIALVLPARLFRVEFQRRGLRPQNLSRAIADAGTVTSPLVPWNSCGAYMSAVLGVSTLLYLPFAIFNIASPLLTIALGFTGFKIERMQPQSEAVAESVPSTDV